jgi:hypothetical protein
MMINFKDDNPCGELLYIIASSCAPHDLLLLRRSSASCRSPQFSSSLMVPLAPSYNCRPLRVVVDPKVRHLLFFFRLCDDLGPEFALRFRLVLGFLGGDSEGFSSGVMTGEIEP